MQDRMIAPISDAELTRRWGLLEDLMHDRGLEALIVQNSNDFLGGYVRWFTGVPATNAYPRTVIFYGRNDLVVVEQGGRGERRRPPENDPAFRGVREVLHDPGYVSAWYTMEADAHLVADSLAERAIKRIGWVSPASAYHGFGRTLATPLAKCVIEDVTDAVDLFKAVKSPEEKAFIRQSAHLQDEVMVEVANYIKPGLHDFEISAFAQYQCQLRGSEQGIFLGSSSDRGRAAVFRPRWQQGRKIEAGDIMSLLIETNGPGGYYTELGRTFVLGKPEPTLVDATRNAIEAQLRTIEQLVPGAAAKDIFRQHNAHMKSLGLPEENRLYCHGQGYDMVERPLIRDDDDMMIVEGMNIVVHPGYVNASAFALVCDNFLVEAEGADPLHRTPKGLIIV